MKQIWGLTLIVCCFSIRLFASTDSLLVGANKSSHFLDLQVGITNFAQRDFMVSPLVYEGTGIASQIAWLRTSSTTKTNACFGFSKATLYNQKQSKQYNMDVEHINAGFTRVRQLNLLNFFKLKSYIGAQLIYSSDFRTAAQFQNSTFTYNIAIEAAPVLALERIITLKPKAKNSSKKEKYIVANWQLAVPLVTAITRPNYNAIRKLRDTNSSVLNYLLRSEMIPNAEINFLNKYIAVCSNLSIDYVLKNGSRLGLIYQWSGAHFNKTYFSYGSVSNAFSISFKAKLSN